MQKIKLIMPVAIMSTGIVLAGCSGTTEAEQSKIVTATPTPTPTVTVTKKAKPKKAPEPDVIIVQPAPAKTVTQAPPSNGNDGSGEYLPSNEEQYLWEIRANSGMDAQAGYPTDREWVKIAGDICNENDKKGTLTAISDWSRNSSLSQDNVLYMWSAASGWYCPEYLYDIPQD